MAIPNASDLKSKTTLVALAVVFICPSAEAASGNVLCIHLYNFAAAPPETAEPAMSRITRIFAKAGIVMTWQQPPADSPEAHLLDLNASLDGSLRSAGHSCLVARIAQDVPVGAYQDALGFAYPFARSGIDVEAVYRRIESQAERVGVDVEVVLAYVIAHEIGHVLLQSSEHAAAGIMQARCDPRNWRLVALDMLAFSPDEAKQMRQGLRRFERTDAHFAHESSRFQHAGKACEMSKRADEPQLIPP